MPRALFATRHADAKKPWSLHRRIRRAPVGVMKQRIARVDDQIITLQKRPQRRNLIVHCLPRGHHQNNRARACNRGDQIHQAVGWHNLRCQFRRPGRKIMRHCRGAVPDGNPEPLFRDVQRQHATHCAKADQANLCVPHGVCAPFRFREIA